MRGCHSSERDPCMSNSATVPKLDRRVKHGKWKTKTFNVWYGMKRRCSDPAVSNYPSYGGRGIRVCRRWEESFSAFLEDMGECPLGYTLDRIDGTRGYAPDNCRWQTPKQQAANRCTARTLTFQGVTHSLKEWSEVVGLKYTTLHERIRRGLPVEKILQKGVLA